MSRKCIANGYSKFDSKVESTLKCPGDPSDADFFTLNGNKAYSLRRHALFNIYSFPSNMSTFKSPPILSLHKVDFEYFLGGYESLIYVENANLQKIEQSFTFTTANGGTVTQTRPHFNFYGADKGMRLKITYGSFKNSRFCKGLVVYRKPLLMVESKSLTNFTNIYSFTGNSDK